MDEYNIIGMVYTGLQTALLACIRYWLYQDNLRVPAKKMYAILFSLCMGSVGLWAASGTHALPFSYYRLTVAVLMFALSCFVIKEPFFKHTFTYSFILVYDSAIEITASFVDSRLALGNRGIVFALTALILLAATFVPAVRSLKSMISKLSASDNNRLWLQLCVICFSFVIMNLTFTYPLSEIPTLRELMSRYLMLLGIIAIYAATTGAVETMREAAQAKAELELVRQRVSIQETYYDRLSSQVDEVRRIKHDLRHHRTALLALAKQGNIAELESYLVSTEVGESVIPVTGNLAADSVLLCFLDAAKSIGTQVETSLAISKDSPISDSDLCVILGNLLENAVDAQRYIDREKRYIRVRASGNKDSLTIAVDNRFDGTIKIEAGEYVSRKSGDGHGLGISSVKVVCKKYGGVLQIETDGDLFMAGVVIGL